MPLDIETVSVPTDAYIKTKYENNANTNAFDDAAQIKLAGVEPNATADQTAAEMKTALETLTGAARLDASAIQNLPAGGGLTDGDYGDVSVGGSGTTLTVDTEAITTDKLAGGVASPGNNKVYGTSATGLPGFFNIPSGFEAYTSGDALIIANGPGVAFVEGAANSGEYTFNIPLGVFPFLAIVTGEANDFDAGDELFVKSIFDPSVAWNQSLLNPIIPSLRVWNGGITPARGAGSQIFINNVKYITESANGTSEVEYANLGTIVPNPVVMIKWF